MAVDGPCKLEKQLTDKKHPVEIETVEGLKKF